MTTTSFAKFRYSFVWLLIAFFFYGCATCATGPLFSPAPRAPYGTSVLYIFRPKENIGSTALVKINGRPFVDLTAAGYSYIYLRPGVYRLAFGGFITEVNIKPGQDLYVRCFLGGMVSVSDVPEAQALAELKDYKFIPVHREVFQ